MKIRINKKLLKKRTKSVRKRKKIFLNEMKEIIENSVKASTNNKELVEKNVQLLAEVESLKREKLSLFESLMFRLNANPILIRNDLMLLLESLRKDHKNMIQLFQTSNEFYNQMINKIENKMAELIGHEDNERIQQNVDSNQTNGRSGEELTTQQKFEMRRISRQMAEINDANSRYDNQMSVIEEATHELYNKSTNISVVNRLESPERGENHSIDYQMTPNFSVPTYRTPSIYNFNSYNSFQANRRLTNCTDSTSISPLNMSLGSDLRLTGFESFDSTITGEQNAITASTPVDAHRMSGVGMIQRPSKRISSINRPYSPRAGRPSLIDIQNVMPKPTNARKKSIIIETSKAFVSDLTNSQSNDTISTNKTKKKGKNWSTISSNDSDMSSSDNSNLSTRSSRRNRKPVSYKEPPLKCKLRQK